MDHSRVLQLMRGRANSPTLRTSEPVLPPASGVDDCGEGGTIAPLPVPSHDR